MVIPKTYYAALSELNYLHDRPLYDSQHNQLPTRESSTLTYAFRAVRSRTSILIRISRFYRDVHERYLPLRNDTSQ